MDTTETDLRARAEVILATDPISKWHAATAQDGDESGPLPTEYVTGEVLAEFAPDQYNEHSGMEFLFDAGDSDLALYIASVPPRVIIRLLDELADTRNRLARAERTIND